MRRRIHVIGIGLGSPEHLTGQAIAALREVDVFLVPDKGEVKEALLGARRAICETYLEPGRYRFVAVADPVRGSDAKRGTADYRASVEAWRQTRVARYAEVIAASPPEAVFGFLVWGDPAFFDSTIGIVDELARDLPAEVRVIPGISAPQALAAAAGISLNRIAGPIHITTGRRLLREWTPELGTVVVMLDRGLACAGLRERAPALEIVWGAYLGLPYQVMRRGRLDAVIDELVALRARLRAEHGWVMDTYLLRAPAVDDDAPPLEE